MKGSTRKRKKHLKQAGWDIDEKEADGHYELVMRKGTGEEMTVTGATRPRAYIKAVREHVS